MVIKYKEAIKDERIVQQKVVQHFVGRRRAILSSRGIPILDQRQTTHQGHPCVSGCDAAQTAGRDKERELSTIPSTEDTSPPFDMAIHNYCWRRR